MRLKENHEREYNRYGGEDDEMVKIYKSQGSLRVTSDIGQVLRKSGGDATVQSCTKLYLNEAAARVEWLYKESALVKVEDVTKQQILWFSPALGSKAAGAASAISAIDTQDITNAAFFGFGLNERDDLLHMMFLCLCLGQAVGDSTCPPPFVDAKMTLEQFLHGLSLVGNPTTPAGLKANMEDFEKRIRVNYRDAPGDYRQMEGAAPGAYRRFWDNMYWVLSSFPDLKCPVRVNADFNKKDQLFVNCLKIAFDLLPPDHPHKREFLDFMMSEKASEFQAQAKQNLEFPTTRQNFITTYSEERYKHYVTAFGQCKGTIAHHEWSNVWFLGRLGPAPDFNGWRSFLLDKLIMDFLKLKNPDIALEDEEDD